MAERYEVFCRVTRERYVVHCHDAARQSLAAYPALMAGRHTHAEAQASWLRHGAQAHVIVVVESPSRRRRPSASAAGRPRSPPATS